MESEQDLLELIDELRAFERKFNLARRFNIFEAVSMVRQEIRHSRFLAFLLDPSESHGLGDRFLRAFLLAAAKSHPSLEVSRLELTLTDCSAALVYCERDHFDITVQIPELRLLFVIENKVDASEGVNQLAKYRATVQSRYKGYRFMGVFLTPDGYDGSDEGWGTASYSDVADELRLLVNEGGMAPESAMAIKHYIELIKRNIVVSEELVNACRRIYTTHRVAMDLILEHGQVSSLSEAFEMFTVKHPQLRAHRTRTNDVHFTSMDWLEVPAFQIAAPKWGASFPVKFWFQLQGRALNLRLEVGPFRADAKPDRSHFVQQLRDHFQAKASKRSSAIYTQIDKWSRPVPEDAGAEDIASVMEEVWAAGNGDATAAGVQTIARQCATSA